MYALYCEVDILPRNKYPEETLRRILDVSLKLFLEKGYEQTTILEIVDNLGGLTRGAFYHHFKSKEEVLEAIFNSDLFSNEKELFEQAKKLDAANGLERLRHFLKAALLSNIESEQNIAMIKFALPLLSNPRFLVEKLKSDQKTAELFTPLIEDGMADGSIKPGNPKVLAGLFMLLANFWMLPYIFPCDREESVAKAAIIKQIFEGFGLPIIDDEAEKVFFRVFDTVMEN